MSNFPNILLQSSSLSLLPLKPTMTKKNSKAAATSLIAIEEKYQFRINLQTLCYAYQTKKLNGTHITLVVRKKRDALILNATDVHDRNWRDEYFFMERSLLGPENEVNYLFDRWNEETSIEEAQYDQAGKVVAEKIYELDLEESTFPDCTKRDTRNYSKVVISEFLKKLGKPATKKDSGESHQPRNISIRGAKKLAGSGKGSEESSIPLIHEIEDDEVLESTNDSRAKGKLLTSPPPTKSGNTAKAPSSEKLMSSLFAAAASTCTKRIFEFKVPRLQLSGRDLFARGEEKSGSTNIPKSGTTSSGQPPRS